MRLSLSPEIKQEQKQSITLRMIHSMEILQMSLARLEERIAQELEQNPLLEIEEEQREETDDEQDETAHDIEEEQGGEDSSSVEQELDIEPEMLVRDERDEFAIADEFAASYNDTIDELPARSQNWLDAQSDYEADKWANIPSRSETLQDYLVAQLAWLDLSPPLRAMVERIIYNLDRHGFFSTPLDDFLGLKTSAEEKTLAEAAVRIVQTLEPVGVGARNLQECLLLQVDDLSKTVENFSLGNPAAQRGGDMVEGEASSPTRLGSPNSAIVRVLIAQHLDDISHNRLPHMVRVSGFSLEAIQEGIAALKKFHPRPAAAFALAPRRVIRPDLFVYQQDDGSYTVSLDEGYTPALHLSASYDYLRRDPATDSATRLYIRQKRTDAQWLLEAIRQRKATLARVAQTIVDYQTDFLNHGDEAIKPLKMQQIAEKLGIHVTTVSRACDDKWMQTAHGLFPLKRFFTGSVASSEGEADVSQDVAFIKLREVIDGENKKKPHSDEELVKLLAEQGVKIARRTVVKYRQAMNIPSSRERKMW